MVTSSVALLYNDCSKKLTDEQIKYFEDIFNTLNNEYDNYSLDVYCTVYKILNENTEIDYTVKNQMQQIWIRAKQKQKVSIETVQVKILINHCVVVIYLH